MADWPDWRGQTAVIVATGPSAIQAALDSIKGKARVIVIKSSWTLCPWADVLYGCDRDWWNIEKGVPGFHGLKASASPAACKAYSDIKLVTLVPRAEILTGHIGRIGCGRREGGGHSGFHAINLAIQFGSKRIALVGFDMRLDHGEHWHDLIKGTRRPDAGQMVHNRKAMDDCAGQIKDLGVEVVTTTRSALKNYPAVDLLDWVSHDVGDYQSRADRPRHQVDAG